MALPKHRHERMDSISINPVYLLKKLLPWRTVSDVIDLFLRIPLLPIRQLSQRQLPPAGARKNSSGDIEPRPAVVRDLRSVGWEDLRTLTDMVVAKLKGETLVDDKTMLMERTIQLVASLPDHSARQEVLTNVFLTKLWDSLDHPPLLYMGDEFRYRLPDGSNNNPLMPKLGAAGTPYARSVKPGKANLGALPDPEMVYEAVMARNVFKKNANNVSSILWHWATIITHDLFRTNHHDPNINDNSAYLDLSPLYGQSKEAIDSVRSFKDGMLKPDTFADSRLIGNPPGVAILLIMFNRFHNHVAANLAEINESNRFPKPPSHLDSNAAAAAWQKYDEELFQTARLITSGLYINITLIDYVRNIVNLNRVNSKWTLDPRQEMGVSVGTAEGAQSGVGSVVSAEFNLCYRWHSCISEMDDQWIQDFYKELLGDNYGNMDIRTLMTAVKKFEMSIPKDPAERTFGGFTRGPDGRFNDNDLVTSLAAAIEQPGGSFGAQNVPRSMKSIEILGILRGRKWNLAGLNEFRKHFGLKAYETFEAINSDPSVADALRNLYGHPDHVELYPGVVAEEAKSPMVPGVGITPTYTISRVVLSDAVSLVRGDRYYTTDYHPGYLTQWGYNEVDYDLDVNHGCSFYKLFIRAFPNHFQQNSVYAHYPMVIPSENHKILANLGRVDSFSFARPQFIPPPVHVSSPAGVKHILNNNKYRVNWQDGLDSIVGRAGRRITQSTEHLNRLFYKNDWKTVVKDFYSEISKELLAEKSFKIAGQIHCDVIRDIGNLAHTHFVARLLNLPLKSKTNPEGGFSEHELYAVLETIATSVSIDVDPVKSYPLRQKARELAVQLGSIVESNTRSGTTYNFTGRKAERDALAEYGNSLIKELLETGLKPDEITWEQVLPTAAALAPNEAQQFAKAVDFYLSAAGQPYLGEIHRLASQSPNPETDALLLGYALEGGRLAGPSGIFCQATAADALPHDGQVRKVRQGDRVFVSLASVARDSERFPSPEIVNPKRPLDSYIYTGAKHHLPLSRVALIELFRALFKKENVRRAPGPQGELKRVSGPADYGFFMTEDWGGIAAFPVSMKVVWDED
ncbi:hypothetical protein HIM_06373 [Hirsutella minnesotensis 3608]|uniref:Linoleate 10R-lipoxygenase n=1 Tax=Hirsutella minnesotensis 3608 TaxID=1043627 RepID=A0A0F7ZZF7_9HYPO|nr:hypothetical protein HIM_06373 [Hirsutella minnesotensis 3608]